MTQRTWYDADWTHADTLARDKSVFAEIPYPSAVDGYRVREWHQQRADCFTGHLIADLQAEGARIPARLHAVFARRVALAIAEAAALESARINAKLEKESQ